MSGAHTGRGEPVIIERGRAKINLTLHIGRRARSKLHPLESLVAFARIGDVLSAAPAHDFSLTVDGPFGASLSTDDDNLVLRAAHKANQTLNLPGAAFRLTKNLPVASGIGGGSADAAAAIRALEILAGHSAQLSNIDLMDIGADVPVCYHNRPALMRGAGEALEFLPDMPDFPAILVNPGIAVSTAHIFTVFDETHAEPFDPPAHLQSRDILARALAGGNDLQAPASSLAPEIVRVLMTMALQDGARLTRMSGSGATCFALFETEAQAEAARAAIASAHPKWWVCATQIGGAP